METVGVIGCGLMGQGIVRNLLKNNYTVYVNDIDRETIANLVHDGARETKNVREISEKADYLMLSLPSPELIEEIILDEQNGAINFLKSGSYIIDMSTNDVKITREIHAQAKLNNIEFFDCPLSGGPSGAEKGELTIMVGGDEKAFSSVLPMLNAVGQHIEYIGESGSGQVVKLCHNMVVGGVITLLSETLLTGEKAGVSKEKISSILQKGSGQTKVMDVFGPNILNDTFQEVNFSLSNMSKDVNLYRNLAEEFKIPTFSSQTIHQLFLLAEHKGKGPSDSTAVYEILTQIGEGEDSQENIKKGER